ncbi:hypothetical protein FIBSPDRAFT_954846 [Athelia psychrophila]|uniref:Uncharacterized protein n=1 Tax=Athelia psychrophila TaxID=1759441 RepID=A0A166IW10_9AGAM|nr:hypothetical protein FIBSPDRAFT_954846 [Fibularhizoctonia sp. CBS 109695]
MIRLNVCMYLPKLSTYPSYAIPSSTPVPYNFDIFIGTLNKPISAATEGYNELIFAYVRTASGRIFALSGDPNETLVASEEWAKEVARELEVEKCARGKP